MSATSMPSGVVDTDWMASKPLQAIKNEYFTAHLFSVAWSTATPRSAINLAMPPDPIV
jgi:hypothetical protein